MKKLLLLVLSTITLMAQTVPFVGFIEGFSMGGYIELTKNNKLIYHECGGTMGCYTMPEWEIDYKSVSCIEDSCYKITKNEIRLLTLNNELIKECDEEGFQYGGSLDCIKKIQLIENPIK